MDVSAELNNSNNKMAFGPRIVRSSDPDVYSNPDSARVRARQIGCIGIRRYNNRDGSVSWMPCTNESDYRRVSGFSVSGRRFRRQQLEREVREIIGGRNGRKPMNKSANYTKPELRETIKKRIMAGSSGGKPGEWSARKAQMLAAAYKKAGGGYKGGKSKTQRSLSSWTRQKWRTSDGKPAIRGNATRRYLPASVWESLTPEQRAATNRKKIIGSRKGKQFVSNTRAAQTARKRSMRGQKHIEFYEDLEFKAIGPRKPRAIRSARSTASFGRRARRIGGSLRDGLRRVPFDPNPIDADADNVAQEGTVHERPVVSRTIDAIRQTGKRTVERMVKPFKKPVDSEDRVFSRAESVSDGRFLASAPQSLVKPRVASRAQRPKKRKIKKSTRAVVVQDTQDNIELKPAPKTISAPRILPQKDSDSASNNMRSERQNIYKAFTVEGMTIAQLADQFDVVRDEIRQTIKRHEKTRTASLRGFQTRNAKLFDAMRNFGNSKNVILEAIKERKIKDWDSMIIYAFKNPEIRKNNKHLDLQNDMFDAFKTGKNPDGTGNLVLGYLPSNKGPEAPPIKAFGDQRKMNNNFRPLYQVSRNPRSTGTLSDISERATRRYRAEYAREATSRRGSRITGAMANPMGKPQERLWKEREWKRRTLEIYSLESNVVTDYPTLASAIGNRGHVDGINYLVGLDDASIDKLWLDTVNDLVTSGKQLPVYQAKNAPLSPNEIAQTMTVKRPLTKIWLDEYKKIAPTGVFANLDVNTMDDREVEAFYNTFILPELTNNGAPTSQDIERAVLAPTSDNRVNAAEQLLMAIPSNMQTLELRLKFAKYTLAQNGVTSTLPDGAPNPDFEAKLQEQMELWSEQAFQAELAELLNPADAPKIKKLVINPKTGETYTEEELNKALFDVNQNIETLSLQVPVEKQEELQQLAGLSQVLAAIIELENFLKTGERDMKTPPLNPDTGKPRSLREWIEFGTYNLAKKPINPLTEKTYEDGEAEKQLKRIEDKATELRNQIGGALLDGLSNQSGFKSRLIEALIEISDRGDFPDDGLNPPDGDTIDKPEEVQKEKSQDELDADIQEFLNAAKLVLEKDSELLSINPNDIAATKKLLRELGPQEEKDDTYQPREQEWWDTMAALVINPATGQPWGPDGAKDPNHPWNAPSLGLTSSEYRLPKDIYDQFVTSNFAREWRDIENSHTVGKYADKIPELSKSAPDKKIAWDLWPAWIAKVSPSLFKRNKKGELVGDINALTQRGDYGGASWSQAEFDESFDNSGFQFKAQLEELYNAKLETQKLTYVTSTSAASKNERARLWQLFETSGLTPAEIAFEEKILDPSHVDSALSHHMVDNNISQTKYNTLINIAQQAAYSNRSVVNNKKVYERQVAELLELSELAGDPVRLDSGNPAGDVLTSLIDIEISRLDDSIKRNEDDYDGFRRGFQNAFNTVFGLLDTRPKNQEAVFDKNGVKVKDGWDKNKETLAQYLNSIRLWDADYLNNSRRSDGSTRISPINILIQSINLYQIRTGDDGAASSTTAVIKSSRVQQNNLLRFKASIETTQAGARRAGISGFMKTGNMFERTEELTKRAARKAADGKFQFIDPKILRSYDKDTLNVTRAMVGSASGFNKRFKKEIRDATRNNDRSLAARPDFNYLNSREKDLARQLDGLIKSRNVKTFRVAQNKRTVGSRISDAQEISEQNRPRRSFSVSANPAIINRRISGTMGNRKERNEEFGGDNIGPGGMYQTGVESINGKFYLVNRHGEIVDPREFSSEYKARAAQKKVNADLRERKQAFESSSNIARHTAASQFVRQSGYFSADVDMQNVNDVSPLQVNTETGNLEPSKFIFAADARPKPQAGDIVVLRKNPDTLKLEVLLIERVFGPHRTDGESTMNLPGGFFSEKAGDKDLFDTARREAFEETGLGLPENELLSMEKLGTIDAIDWDPRFAKGMEVSALMIEVPSTWNPKAGDDAAVAKFMPLEKVANGDIPLGFGHMAWLEEAFGGHEDAELAELGAKFATLNILARQRQQRIIKGANKKRRELNETPLVEQPTLFDKELPKLNLFPENLPDSEVGWIPMGSESAQRRAQRIGNVQKKIRGNMALGIGKPVPNITGRMTSGLKELDVEGFAKLGKGRRQQITDDVYNMRRAGMDKRTIASQLAILYSTPPKKKNNSDLSGFAPTDELIFQIISDGKKLGKFKIASTNKKEVLDKYSKRVLSDQKDVINFVKNGLTAKDISEALDISESRTKTYLTNLGFSQESLDNSISNAIDVDKRIANAPIAKAIYIDSTYGRMSVADLAKKYKMDKSKIAESINSHRALAESLEQDSHRLYKEALNAAEINLLSADEIDIVRMRLDGLSSNEIMLSKKLNNADIKILEQTALAKLRAINSNNFLELDNELAIQTLRKNPTFQYMTNLLTENTGNLSGVGLFNRIKNKEFAARELRDYRNVAKDFYMMNQYMGISVDKLSRQYKTPKKDVEQFIDIYTQAIKHSDKFKNKALRRALAADIYNSFLDGDINFISMRNDGASIKDISRYFESKPETLRIRQMVLMNKLNQQQGISGMIQNVPNLKNRDLYAELGVSDNSSIQEIENAFKSIAESSFPLAMNNDTANLNNLKRASEAFSILGNPTYRDSYHDMFKENYKVIRELELEMANDLMNNWPQYFYKEPTTEKMRPKWVRDAINGKPINSQNIFKLPHHLGSDEIIDDIDDGILGFPINDSVKEFSISDAFYRKPVPGTPEWQAKKEVADRIIASGDPRYGFDEDGFVTTQNMVFISKYDDPMSPDYIGDQFGGPPKGVPISTVQYASSTTKKKIKTRNSNNFSYGKISGRMAGMFDGLSAKEKEDKIQKLIAGFAEGNDMLPNYRRGKRVPIPVFPENKLDTINIAEIRKLPKIERVKKMLDFVREELANDRPIYSHTSLGDVFSLPIAGVDAILPGEIPTYSTRKKEAWKKWKNALSAYVLDNKNKTLLDLADEIAFTNNERLVDQAPELGLLRKEFFGPITPFKKRKSKNIVRLRNGKEFTKKEYKILQRKLLKMWSEGFAPTDIDKKLDVPEKWAQYQIRDLAKQNKLPKLPSPELSIIQYAADGFTATDMISRFFRRENWSDWDTDRIMEFVKKDGRFPNFKRGFRKVEDELANNAFVQKPLLRFREKRKNMNSRAIAELNRIELDRAKKALERMKIEEPTRYQELQAKRRAVAKKRTPEQLAARRKYQNEWRRRAVPKKRTPEQLAARRKYQNEWRERTGRTKKSNKTKLPKISGEMASLDRKFWVGRDFYKELEADLSTNINTLRRQYRLMSKKYHPDKNPGNKQAAEQFRAAAEAWRVLSNPGDRALYDAQYYPAIFLAQTGNQPNVRAPQPAAPPRPPTEAEVFAQRPPLPPLDDSLAKRIKIKIPFTKTNLPYDYWKESFSNYTNPPVGVPYVTVPATFGAPTRVEENRFWDVYYAISDAMVKTIPASSGNKKRFISLGGAPGSGKTTIRKLGIPTLKTNNILDERNAVHIDADEIKTLIPEAINAHANNNPNWATIGHEESRIISDMAIRMSIEQNRDIVYDSTGQFNRGFDTLVEARNQGYSIELHYAVASTEKILSDRVKKRAKTDPREMPGHIIPATLSRNTQIMHQLAEYADNFYLWDTETQPPVLLVSKEGVDSPIVINSPRAFLHGFFEDTKQASPENIIAIKKIFDKPNFNIRNRGVSKNSRSAQIINEYEKRKSIALTAARFKSSEREVFDIVTGHYIDPTIKDPVYSAVPPRPRPGEAGTYNPNWRNSSFQRPDETPPYEDVDPGEEFVPSDENYNFSFSKPIWGISREWYDSLGKPNVEEMNKKYPLLARAMFTYTPAEMAVLDFIAFNQSAKNKDPKYGMPSLALEYYLTENVTTRNIGNKEIEEVFDFDAFWFELEMTERENASTQEADIIERLLTEDEGEVKEFMVRHLENLQQLTNIYPDKKPERSRDASWWDPKLENDPRIQETTKAINELIANNETSSSDLATMWAFSQGIELSDFNRMYLNVRSFGKISGG